MHSSAIYYVFCESLQIHKQNCKILTQRLNNLQIYLNPNNDRTNV